MTRKKRGKSDLSAVELPTENTEYQGIEAAPSEHRELGDAELKMRDAQIALIALGYLDINTREILGEPKGTWGPESRAGLRAFLRDHEMPVTDELDAQSYRCILAAYDAALEARASAAAEVELQASPHEKRPPHGPA